MRVWVLKDGENLPIQQSARPMRTWMLADALVERGHDVIWWASTFSHQQKVLVATADQRIEVAPGFAMQLLHAGTYKGHASVARYQHHRRLGARFKVVSGSFPPPDLIICSFPIIHLAYEAVKYARERDIPVIVDVRDLWPETLVNLAPRPLRGLARIALRSDFAMTRWLLRSADALVGVSSDALHWAARMAGRPVSTQDRVFYIGYPRINATRSRRSDKIEAFAKSVEGQTVFCFAGSVGHAWDVELVCKAARLLANHPKGRGLHFALAGGGPNQRTVERHAKSLPNVTWLGWLDRNEINDLLAVSHVGLAPHRFKTQSMPNKVFEYLAAGLPLLSSLHGETERFLTDAKVGLTYPSGNVDAFADLAMWFADHPEERSEMGHRARELFDTTTSNQAGYAEYAMFAEDIAAGRPLTSGTAA